MLPESLTSRLQTLLADPPASKALAMMPGDQEELVRFVEQHLGPRETLIQAAADAVRTGAITMGMLAWAAERPVALAFAQRAAGLIPAASISGTHIAAEIRAVRDALNHTAVLDVSALAVASLIPGRLDQLRAVFTATPTTTAVYDDIIRTRYALDNMLRSSGQMGVRDGRFTISEYSHQDKAHLAQQAAIFARIIPSLQPVEVPDLAEIHARLGLPTVPNEADAAGLSAAQHALDTGAALWCDDTAMRDLLIKADIPTFGTVALLHVLAELSDYPEFTDERHDRDMRSLLEAWVVDLPIAVDDIAEVAAAEGWQPASAAALFARPQLWAVDASRTLWAPVAEKVWDNEPDRLRGWFELAAVGVSTWMKPEEALQAVIQLVR
ncbi:PIN domain-containing protein [Streptomyces sp. MI02-7b]|uniref:PIN domain-containing protein n=1 Tax=Streptomyces sp. MI02-7b TaxID=462941 RepID=UPI0039F57764